MTRVKKIPVFTSKVDEARWFDEHGKEEQDSLAQAIRQRKAGQGLEAMLRQSQERAGASPTITIRIDPEDIASARRLAESKGLRYQTYIKMLLHEALKKESRRAT